MITLLPFLTTVLPCPALLPRAHNPTPNPENPTALPPAHNTHAPRPTPQAVDQVFTFERWNRHRRSYRYAKHLANMFSSRVFRQLLGPVLAVMALALFVGVYETLVNVRRARSLHMQLGDG